jgi:hypothetical protein
MKTGSGLGTSSGTFNLYLQMYELNNVMGVTLSLLTASSKNEASLRTNICKVNYELQSLHITLMTCSFKATGSLIR